jgi:hypothetical protein
METYVLAVEGLDSLKDFDKLDQQLVTRARQAINRTIERTRTASGRAMRKEIDFAARYLSGSGGRLRITNKATNAKLEATLLATDSPTSLARFATNRSIAASRKSGVRVKVSPGETRAMGSAFLMNLKGGNVGLALRLKPGESVRNKKFMTSMGKGLYLLYGPAVNQVFAGVATDQIPDALDFMEREFSRLMEL